MVQRICVFSSCLSDSYPNSIIFLFVVDPSFLAQLGRKTYTTKTSDFPYVFHFLLSIAAMYPLVISFFSKNDQNIVSTRTGMKENHGFQLFKSAFVFGNGPQILDIQSILYLLWNDGKFPLLNIQSIQ